MNGISMFSRLTALSSILLAGWFLASTVHGGELASPQQPVPVSVEMTLSESKIRIAEPVEAVVTVIAAENVTINFPNAKLKLGAFDVIDVQDRFGIPMGDRRKWIRRYHLDSVLAGEQVIPAIEIGYVDRRTATTVSGFVKTEAMAVTIESSLEGAEDPMKFRDIKSVVFLAEPKRPSYGWTAWTAGGVLGVFGLVAIVMAIRRKPRRSPRAVALGSLEQLSKSDELQEGNAEFVYETLTDIVRQFVHAELKISAPTLTTSEFLNQLKQDSQLSETMRTELQKFLESADMVKFAGLSPERETLVHSIAVASDFVTSCESSQAEGDLTTEFQLGDRSGSKREDQ